MTMDERALEGSAPPEDADLTEVIDDAFDYRGDVTVVRRDGGLVVGYVFNRDRDASAPFLQMFPAGDGAPVTIRYAEIRSIRFTGKDPAAGTSYAAWLRRKEAGSASREDV
jgi:hypothetical protein